MSEYSGLSVTMVSRIFRPESAAAAFRLGALVDELVDEGADVLVLTTKPASKEEPLPPRGAKVRRWPVLRDSAGQVRGYVQYMSFDIPVAFRLLFSRRADVVIVEPPPTTGFVVRMACAVRGVPYVYYAADVWSDASASIGTSRFVVRAVRALERWVMNGASAVVAVNEQLAVRVRELAVRAEVQVVGNGVDTSIFSSDGEVAASGEYAIYAGTTSEWQGAEVFVDAFVEVLKLNPSARLVYLGQGSSWESLRVKASELGVAGSVDFVPSVPPVEAAQWLRGASVSVVSMRPGQGYEYALPTKILASVACGTPVIYAGPAGPASDFIGAAPAAAGVAIPYDVSAIAHELQTRLGGGGRSKIPNKPLAEWAAESVSLAAVARRVGTQLNHSAGR